MDLPVWVWIALVMCGAVTAVAVIEIVRGAREHRANLAERDRRHQAVERDLREYWRRHRHVTGDEHAHEDQQW